MIVLVSLIVFLRGFLVSMIFRIVHPIPISPFIQIFALVIYFKYVRQPVALYRVYYNNALAVVGRSVELEWKSRVEVRKWCRVEVSQPVA